MLSGRRLGPRTGDPRTFADFPPSSPLQGAAQGPPGAHHRLQQRSRRARAGFEPTPYLSILVARLR